MKTTVTRHDVERAESDEAFEHSSIIQEIRFWGKRQFPNRTRAGLVNHLKEEISEFIESGFSDHREAADILHIMIQLADFDGVDIEAETRDKFNENKRRVWPTTPNENGYYKHVS